MPDPTEPPGPARAAQTAAAGTAEVVEDVPWSRRSPFVIGMIGAAGVAVTVAGVELVVTAREVLVLIGLAMFIALGLEPAVAWLTRHRLPRWAAVTSVCLGALAVTGGFLAIAIPTLVSQGSAFVDQVPHYIQELQDRSSFLGQLNERFHIQQTIQDALSTNQESIITGVLGAGAVVVTALGSTLVVIVLSVYFLGSFPRLRAGLYRLFPRRQRPRARELGDAIVSQVGSYVLGNFVISLIAGTLTFIWLTIFGVPYALLLGVLVAILDLIPAIGSIVAGAIVSLVALTVSLPVAIATLAFFIVYKLIEDYVLIPRIIGRAVEVSALLTVVAVLVGGVLLGVIGALVAIPIAAAVQLIMREVFLPRITA